MPNGMLATHDGASMAAPTNMLVTPVRHRLPDGASSRSSANGSNHVDSGVLAATNGMLVTIVSSSAA